MVIIGGSNVYPAEVENALYQHPAVAEVAVYGVPHATLGECVRATVVRRPGVCVTADELLAHCGDHLARYKIPASIDFASSLPKTGAGKVLKRVLRSAAVSTAISRVESATDLERHTCGWMARELGIGLSAIDPARPFADYGFTSLMAVQLAGLLSQWLNREIAATITWEFSSARALARHLLPEVAEPDGPVLHQMAARIAELSDDEAEAILIDELGRLQGAAAGRR
jgi:acyl carrier protein